MEEQQSVRSSNASAITQGYHLSSREGMMSQTILLKSYDQKEMKFHYQVTFLGNWSLSPPPIYQLFLRWSLRIWFHRIFSTGFISRLLIVMFSSTKFCSLCLPGKDTYVSKRLLDNWRISPKDENLMCNVLSQPC